MRCHTFDQKWIAANGSRFRTILGRTPGTQRRTDNGLWGAGGTVSALRAIPQSHITLFPMFFYSFIHFCAANENLYGFTYVMMFYREFYIISEQTFYPDPQILGNILP